MKKPVVFLFIAILTAMLSGCILSKIPTKNDVTMILGEQITFSVKVYPSNEIYVWTLDGATLSNTGKSFVYSVQEGKHTLTVKAMHDLVADKQTWNIYGNSPPIANAGGDESVAIDSTPKFFGGSDSTHRKSILFPISGNRLID
jgi:hypothetical protein